MINQEFIESITLEGEEWRDVIGYEGLYMVSSFGRVISLKRSQIITIFNKAKKEITFLPKLLKFNKIKGYNKCKFYNSVMVYKDKKAKRIPVHRLVASAFIENPNSYTQIDHIDTNRLNNRIENLRWCDSKTNSTNPISLKNMSIAAKQTYLKGRKPINIRKVVQLKNGHFFAVYDSIKDASMQGFRASNISNCCQGREKSHYGYQWMYLSDYEKLTNKSKNDLPISADNV